MKKSRFSEAQIVGILKEVEMGAKVGETCRKHGVSEPTYYKWKSQFSGMTVSHLSQLRQLQDENAKLKRMHARRDAGLRGAGRSLSALKSTGSGPLGRATRGFLSNPEFGRSR